MDELRIGDFVSVGNDKFEPVYSFGHYDPASLGTFLQIETINTALQVSIDHMVFVQGKGPIPSSNILIGDKLQGGLGQEHEVISIKRIISKGLFAPFTPSGTIVVNDIVASSFVAFEGSSSLRVVAVDVSYQWLAHSFEFPHRVVCYYAGNCPMEAYDENGVSVWNAIPLRLAQALLEQSSVVRTLLLVSTVMVLVFFYLTELLITRPVVFASICLGHWAIRRRGTKRP